MKTQQKNNEMTIALISNDVPVTVVSPLTDGELFTYNVSQNDETVFISLIDVDEMSSHGVIVFYKQLNIFEIMLPILPETATQQSKYGLFDKITTASSHNQTNNQLATTVCTRQFYLKNNDNTAAVTVDTLTISATNGELMIIEQSYSFTVTI